MNARDDRGRTMGRGSFGAEQSVVFQPEANFHYRTPRGFAETYQGSQYYLQMPDGPSEGYEISILINTSEMLAAATCDSDPKGLEDQR